MMKINSAPQKKLPLIAPLTGVRALAAIWVVLYHFNPDGTRLFAAWHSLVSPIAINGELAVDLFFLLSGFVLAYNYLERFARITPNGYFEFIFMRLARVYPVHLAALLAVVPMMLGARYMHHALTDAGYTPTLFVMNILLIHYWMAHPVLSWNYPSWSISCEWFAYLLFPPLCVLLLRLRQQRQIVIATVIALAITFALNRVESRIAFGSLVRISCTFVSGCLLWRLASTRVSRLWWFDVLAGAAFIAVIGIQYLCRQPSLILMVLFVILLFGLGTGHDRYLRFLTKPAMLYAGEISYSLYMTHTLSQKLLYVLLPSSRFVKASFLSRLSVASTYAVLIAVLAILSYHLIEWPARERLRSWWRGEKRSPADRFVFTEAPVLPNADGTTIDEQSSARE
jgi:peptidoglycan/LPS O-acetylase OafA/YrhL